MLANTRILPRGSVEALGKVSALAVQESAGLAMIFLGKALGKCHVSGQTPYPST